MENRQKKANKTSKIAKEKDKESGEKNWQNSWEPEREIEITNLSLMIHDALCLFKHFNFPLREKT